MSGKPVPLEGRFWAKVDKRGPDECWLWKAASLRGYGLITDRTHSPVTRRAHRVAYELCVGPIPNGMHVLHKCDVPGCCNPAHLFLGTQTDNMRDMSSKGRRKTARGEACGAAKLTLPQVEAIRSATTTQKEMAKRFGVSEHQIWCIRKGMHWQ